MNGTRMRWVDGDGCGGTGEVGLVVGGLLIGGLQSRQSRSRGISHVLGLQMFFCNIKFCERYSAFRTSDSCTITTLVYRRIITLTLIEFGMNSK